MRWTAPTPAPRAPRPHVPTSDEQLSHREHVLAWDSQHDDLEALYAADLAAEKWPAPDPVNNAGRPVETSGPQNTKEHALHALPEE